MTMKERIVEDMKTAMRAHEKERLATIRLILAELKQQEVDERISLNDDQVLDKLTSMIKKRRDAIKQFNAGNRLDLAKKEEDEIKVIMTYLPKQLTEAEIDQLIAAAISETGAQSIKDMKKVITILKEKTEGKADISVVSNKVKALLG